MDENIKLTEVIKNKDDLATYKALQLKIAATIDASKSGRDIASLSRQLREVTEKISELEARNKTDGIADILEARARAGKTGAVRDGRGQPIWDN